jgi:hypothetical protein
MYTVNRLPYKDGIAEIELEEIGRYKSYTIAHTIAEALEYQHDLDLFFVIEEQEIVII